MGGTGDIGGAVCDTLARQGCRIVVIDLDEDRCAAKAASLPGADAHSAYRCALFAPRRVLKQRARANLSPAAAYSLTLSLSLSSLSLYFSFTLSPHASWRWTVALRHLDQRERP